jgi:hypothetical protein
MKRVAVFLALCALPAVLVYTGTHFPLTEFAKAKAVAQAELDRRPELSSFTYDQGWQIKVTKTPRYKLLYRSGRDVLQAFVQDGAVTIIGPNP